MVPPGDAAVQLHERRRRAGASSPVYGDRPAAQLTLRVMCLSARCAVAEPEARRGHVYARHATLPPFFIRASLTQYAGEAPRTRPRRSRTTSRCGSGRRTARGCRPGRGTRRPRRTASSHVAPRDRRRRSPIASAPASETTASATSVRLRIRVRSGRPFSSSSACAPTPIASDERRERPEQAVEVERAARARRRARRSERCQRRVRRVEQRDVVAPAARARARRTRAGLGLGYGLAVPTITTPPPRLQPPRADVRRSRPRATASSSRGSGQRP